MSFNHNTVSIFYIQYITIKPHLCIERKIDIKIGRERERERERERGREREKERERVGGSGNDRE